VTIGEIIRNCIAVAVVGVGFAFALLGFVYQCGETYVDAQGVRHVVECPLPEFTSSWLSTSDPAK
jgi:hypothetical protein